MIPNSKIEHYARTQSNDASSHNGRPNGHKARSSLKRHASKVRRQFLDKELEREIGNATAYRELPEITEEQPWENPWDDGDY